MEYIESAKILQCHIEIPKQYSYTVKIIIGTPITQTYRLKRREKN
jgi:hypothetical protein